ncbi:MAG TPA: hypothetical protein VMM55_04425 [Thermohalobaculum sp.]|nr:hypothetical protein [Thermohalobaculum sp.]
MTFPEMLLAVPAFLLALGPAEAARATQQEEAAALGARFSHETVVRLDGEPVVRIEQHLDVDACDAVVTTTHYAPGDDGARRMVERSRFEIGRMDVVERAEAEEATGDVPAPLPDRAQLDLTARDYFVRAGDDGLSRWLAALRATRTAPDRSAEMRALQFRVAAGEFGPFARANGYEMRSYLEGDPEPYYAMPLPAISLSLPVDAEAAVDAWTGYAAEHCPR